MNNNSGETCEYNIVSEFVRPFTLPLAALMFTFAVNPYEPELTVLTIDSTS